VSGKEKSEIRPPFSKNILKKLRTGDYQLIVEDFPAIVVNDLHGGDLYKEGRAQYRRRWPK
jgi:hypothetical protein